MVTAYDEPGARLAAAAGVDILLVGDSLANVVLGHDDTLHVSVDDMCHHVRAVAAAKPDVHVVADMPWLSYHVERRGQRAQRRALDSKWRRQREVEGGRVRREVVRAILDAEIPVMAHLGLTPQSVMAFGGFKVQAKTREAAQQLQLDAKILQDEGVFAIVIEGVPNVVGTRITEALDVPTIGIGAGPDTDGQVLVFHDLLGTHEDRAGEVRASYADLNSVITEAIAHFASDVRSGEFPGPDEVYPNPDELVN